MKRSNNLIVLIQKLKRLSIITLSLSIISSCTAPDEKRNENIQSEMVSLMNSLRDAAIEINADKVMNLCLETPEFFFFADGSVMNYDQFEKDVRDSYQNMVNHKLIWDTLYVKILSPGVASALAPFHQEITQNDGVVIRLEGEVTWSATQTESGLKLIYAHAAHRNDTTSY